MQGYMTDKMSYRLSNIIIVLGNTMNLLADLPRFHYQRSTSSNGVCLVNINISWLYIMTVIVNFMGCSKTFSL